MKKYVAELIGTMVLVLLGCGSAVFAGGVADTVGAGVGTIGVAMAFGLSVIAMAYTIGNISGCHINPAITLGVWVGRHENETGFDVYAVSGCRRHYRFADSHAAGIDRCTRRTDGHRLQQLCV